MRNQSTTIHNETCKFTDKNQTEDVETHEYLRLDM